MVPSSLASPSSAFDQPRCRERCLRLDLAQPPSSIYKHLNTCSPKIRLPNRAVSTTSDGCRHLGALRLGWELRASSCRQGFARPQVHVSTQRQRGADAPCAAAVPLVPCLQNRTAPSKRALPTSKGDVSNYAELIVS